ncbi:hypothetical protein B7463_g3971, partial [Scytalidium lignicola]
MMNASGVNEQDVSAKRRKIRKGTQSCWECKRRKIRCVLLSAEDTACVGCQRRRAPCISQEIEVPMLEDLTGARTRDNRQLVERMARVEALLEDFLAGKVAVPSVPVEKHLVQHQDHQARSAEDLSTLASSQAIRSLPTAGFSPEEPREPAGIPTLGQSTPSPSLALSSLHATALEHLFAAFPTEEDAKILLRESFRVSLYTETINTQPHSKLTYETLAAPCSIPELPGPSTHPVLLAKRMLLFAITLQSPGGEELLALSEPRSVLMCRLVTAATTWVTTKEEMHGTVESLVCIMLEGVYEINSGNLRRAWVAYRRAMTVAQLMGLHRTPMPPLKCIDPELDAKPDFMWFRIVYMDRYLSLLLGLPQGSTDTSMGAMSALRHEPPLGKFERLLTVVASRILERNASPFATTDTTTTQSIDSELLSISQSMPASFWRPVYFHNFTPGSPDTLLETLRLAAQVYYYGLLIQLHLPYIVRIRDNTMHEYSKMTCVNASREIITRFIVHRSFNPMSSCSRPVDLFALLAAMTLLLAHIDVYHHRQTINFLAHQRFSDRAILEQALEKMDVISKVNKDIVTEQSAKLVRRLLEIEADAAQGSNYTARTDDGGEKGDEELRLHIPYLGVIKITRQGPISREPHPTFQAESSSRTTPFAPCPHPAEQPLGQPTFPDDHPQSGHEQPMLQYHNSNDITLESQICLPPIAAGVDDWAFQGVDMAFFDSLMKGTLSSDSAGFEQVFIEDGILGDGRGRQT